ncbi:MAG: peroxiredoxin, partial [Actinobacteria bacterium]|nr:peroxiredoxin [Actinomycetota bacterium]
MKTGDTAPDFSLLDQTGEKVTLSELLKAGPV